MASSSDNSLQVDLTKLNRDKRRSNATKVSVAGRTGQAAIVGVGVVPAETGEGTRSTDPVITLPGSPDDPASLEDPSGEGVAGSGPGSGVNTSAGTTVSADDLLDGLDGPQFPDVTSDESTNSSAPLSGLDGVQDCGTGQCVLVHTDGVFPTPEGWASPDDSTGSCDATWESGKYWSAYSTPGIGATPGEAMADFIATHTDSLPNPGVAGQSPDGVYRWQHSWSFKFASTASYSINGFEYVGGTAGNFIQSTCIPGSFDYCPTICPPLEEWPEDGCYDLALIDGEFVSHPLDTEAPDPPAEDKSSVTLCTAGGRQVKAQVASDGGFMVYEVDPSSGAGTGTVFVYDSGGTLRAAGGHSTQFINLNSPRVVV